MVPQLQEYARKDDGYNQFCEQYKLAVADPATRREYFFWLDDRLHETGIWMAGERIGREEERKKAETEKRDILRGNIRRMASAGMDDITIAEMLDFPVTEILNYK